MKILVIAAHPDDEALGCGGTLLKLANHNEIFLAFGADGVSGRYKEEKITEHEAEIEKRRKESQKAAKILKAKILNSKDDEYYPFRDQRIARADFNSVVDWINSMVKKSHPEIIFTHFAGDINIDHRMVAEALAVATRPGKFDFIKKIYTYEINTNHTNQGPNLKQPLFAPNAFYKINIEAKYKLFNAYQSEQWPTWKEDLKTIAKFRGMNSGYDSAEGFELIRERHD